jgi:hypothetical protein
LVNNAFANQA